MQENADQNNSKSGHFSRSESIQALGFQKLPSTTLASSIFEYYVSNIIKETFLSG